MLFAILIFFFGFLDWFESGGWILVIGIPVIMGALGYGLYQEGKRAGRRDE